jgi:hypothetical protein
MLKSKGMFWSNQGNRTTTATLYIGQQDYLKGMEIYLLAKLSYCRSKMVNVYIVTFYLKLKTLWSLIT